ncbi:hypothetical protein DFH06DRAFT_1129171 [Mycena polygramma]|nr:hypothetical protein DFH06DRAFT_1129171 [Mycena polygramma]
MPLFCFTCFSSRDDSSSALDFEVCTGPPRWHAEEPPLLGSTNLFDTFPRVVFGGYRQYYQSRVDLDCNSVATGRSQPFEPSLSSIVEDPWSWQNLPKFNGTKRRRVRRTNSSLCDKCPKLRKKPRFHASARPLVDRTYTWPNWLLPDSDSLDKHPAL